MEPSPLACQACLALAALSCSPAAAAAGPHRALDDTGATHCLDAQGAVTTACARSGQDAGTGRDATHDDGRDGHAGFSFTKIDAAGQALPATAATWSCVRDRVTGLLWEVKTHDGTARDGRWRWTLRPAGPHRAAQDYLAGLRDANFCGTRDWRLPTLLELTSLVDEDVTGPGARIDGDWFPDTAPTDTWTSDTSAYYGPDSHWTVAFDADLGGDRLDDVHLQRAVLAVQGPPLRAPRQRFVLSQDEATDRVTRLAWRRCSEGQAWTGSTCAGPVTLLSFADAIAQAASEAARTGQGWRVPNTKELASLVDRRRSAPAFDPIAFPGTPASQDYWTSTLFLTDPARAWSNNTWFGYTHGVSATGTPQALRLVRDAD